MENKEYAVIFAKGDEAFSGLHEFAERYQIQSDEGRTCSGRTRISTLEVMVTVDPIATHKRLDPETDLTLIDPTIK
jgi:predicted DNA-binding protein with PD1-like motif